MKNFENPSEQILLIFNLKLINYKQLAMNYLLPDYFISDIDFPIAINVY